MEASWAPEFEGHPRCRCNHPYGPDRLCADCAEVLLERSVPLEHAIYRFGRAGRRTAHRYCGVTLVTCERLRKDEEARLGAGIQRLFQVAEFSDNRSEGLMRAAFSGALQQ